MKNQESRIRNQEFPIVILHGWGIDGLKYGKVVQLFKKEGYDVFSPDLPGFGKELLVKKIMTIDDYVQFVKDYLAKKTVRQVILIGHSFGGRVAIKFSIKYPQMIKALILTGAPGIKHKLSTHKRMIMYASVILGELFKYHPFSQTKDFIRKVLYFMIGEWDYYRAGYLRETFKKIIVEDLKQYLPALSMPTLLLWGENDKMIPLSDGKKMQQLIPKSTLVVIKNAGHKVPYEQPEIFFKKTIEFIEKL